MSSRPAFAIPMVILLTIVMSLTLAVMLERQGAQRLQVSRTLDSYNDHHLMKGIQEVVNAWLRTLPNVPLTELLGEDGKIVEISMLDGVRLSIFVEDGQQSIRFDPSSIRAESQHIEASEIVRLVSERFDGRIPADLRRYVGPVSVSASAAPREVIEAVAELALEDESKASQFADFIMDARDDGVVSQGEVAGGASSVQAASGQRAMLARLIGEPVLWKVRVEVGRVPRAGLSPRPVTAYEGHIFRPSRQTRNQVQQNVLDQQVPFLSWREVPLTEVE